MSGCLKAASLTAGLTVAVVPSGSLGLCSEGDATLRAVSAQSTGKSNKKSNFYLKLGKEKVQKPVWKKSEAGPHLEEQAVDHDEVANGQFPGADSARGGDHGRRNGAAKNEALTKVEQREACLSLQRSRLIVCRFGRELVSM